MMENDQVQVTEDDEPFLIQQAQVDSSLKTLRESMKPSLLIDCIDCGEEIGSARKKALPSAVRCIDCQEVHDGR